MSALPYVAGGVGLAALENQLVGEHLPDELKHVNLGLGGLTGLLLKNPDPKVRASALGSIPLKQLSLFAIGGMDRLRQAQQDLTDTNLQTAKTNLRTALVAGNSEDAKRRMALLYLLPALAGGGGLAYYAWNKRTRPKPERFQTVTEKGKPGQRRIRLEIPPSAFPKEFFESLVDVDENPRTRTRLQVKNSSWLPELAGEFTGVSPLMRAGSEAASALGSLGNGRYDQTDRYGLSALSNAAGGAVGVNMFTLPLLSLLLKRPRLGAMRNGTIGPVSRLGQGKLPTLSRWLTANSRYGRRLNYGTHGANPLFSRGGVVGTQAQRRQQQGLSMRSPIDRLYAMKHRADPKLFDFNNPASNSWLVRNVFSAPKMAPTTQLGHLGNAARYAGNRGINAAYRGYKAMRRNPNMSMFAASIPFASSGSLRDKEDMKRYEDEWKNRPTAPRALPISSGLNNLLSMVGAENPNAGILSQLKDGPSRDPYSMIR